MGELRILVRSPNWIGDQILAYPFFHYLRRVHPKARIAAACLPWVESVQFRNLVDDVQVLPTPDRKGFRARLEAVEQGARELREKGPWDVGYCLPNSLSSAWLMMRAGARERRGYSADGRGILLKPGLDWEGRSTVHRAEDYVGLLPSGARPATDPPVREFWGVPPENELDPGVPGVVDRFDARRAWPLPAGAESDRVKPPSEPYWVLAPGSQASSRRWPVEAFAELAREVLAQKGWRGVIVGGPGEVRLAMKLTEDKSLGLVDMTAQGPIPMLTDLFARAKFTVSNDSGLAHVAALCGSPTQIVWGAGDPKRTEPLGPGRVRVIFNPIECWPCERNSCDLPAARRLECLRGIAPADVWNEVRKEILRDTRPS
jgi:heptosyltransferase-2